MTRKDYDLLAYVLRKAIRSPNYAESVGGGRIARDLADELAADNPRFDRDRFLYACGLED